MDPHTDESVPPGYRPHDRRSPLTEPWEPLYARMSAESIDVAVRVREAHCNSRGFAHGGMISALADNAMGLSLVMVARRRAGQHQARAVTVSLALDFLETAAVGEWLEFLPCVLKAGGTLGFVECRIVCGDRAIARGNATFRLQNAAQ